MAALTSLLVFWSIRWFVLSGPFIWVRICCSRLASVRQGVDFAKALAAPDVVVILVDQDLYVEAPDWSGFDRPLVIRRNVTIQASPSGTMPVVSIRSSDGAVRLAEGVALKIMNVVIVQNRLRLGVMSPGLDMLTPSPASETGSFAILQNLVLVHPLCLPPDRQVSYFSNITRPAAFAGPQSVGPLLPQALNCINSSSAPLLQRCWPQRGLYVDLVLPGQDPDEQGRLRPTNVIIQMLNVEFACAGIMREECIQELGVTACFLYMSTMQKPTLGTASPPSPAPPLPPWPPSLRSPPALSVLLDGDARRADNRQHLLIVMLPCVLGGLLVVILTLAIGWATWHRCRSSRYRHGAVAVHLAPTPGRRKHDPVCKGRSTGSPSTESTELPQQLCKEVGMPAAEAAAVRSLSGHLKDKGTLSSSAEVTAITAVAALDVTFIVTPFTQHRSDLKLGVQCDTEVVLLPVVRGQGNFGRVVEGVFNGERVAVKLVPDPLWSVACGLAALDSYVQEVEVLGRCCHPNVVRLRAACVTPPRLCLVMELMEMSLDRLIHTPAVGQGQLQGNASRLSGSSGPDTSGRGGVDGSGGRSGEGEERMLLPLDKVLHVGIEIARGLEYLHPTIVHRDLKPGNVLLNDPFGPRPVVKLTDFGLSRLRSTVLVTRHPEAGTPPYMAPELYDITNNVVTDKSDIYSLGVLLWEMLTGQVPWHGCDPLVVAYAVTINRDRLPLSRVSPERLPPKLHRLIKRLWDHDPLRRPAAAEVVKQLAIIQQSLATGQLQPQSQGQAHNHQ